MSSRQAQSALALSDADALCSARLWMDWFLAQPHPLIGRKGHVCPFVEHASRAGTLRAKVRHVDVEDLEPEARLAVLSELLAELEAEFRKTEWEYRNKTLHAMVYVLPSLPPDAWSLLDELQAAAKSTLADRNLMLGQFHPDCLVPAARNASFPVSRAPVPMLAMRNMAFHDILFLGSDRSTFESYARHFGSRYANSAAGLDPLFVQLYQAALQRFGPDAIEVKGQ